MNEKTKKLVELLKQALDDNAICVIGERNNGGADHYSCPGCSTYERIMGEATSTNHGG